MKKLLLITLAICFILPHFAHADITTGLYGEWKFNEGSGTTAADSSGNSNTGTLSGTNVPTWAVGNLYANALSNTVATGGSGGYVSTTNSISGGISTGVTESAWVYPTSLTGQGGLNIIISTNNGEPYPEVLSNGHFAFVDRGNTTHEYTGATISTNAWVFLAVTCANTPSTLASTVTMYINGSSVKQDVGSGACNFNLSTTKITVAGFGASLGSFGFTGRIQDARFYTRDLTSTDIAELYAFPPSSASPPFYKFFVSLGSAFMVTLGSVFQIQ